MKRIFTALAASLIAAVSLFAQPQTHVSWKTGVESLGDGLYEITATARMDAGWHIYDLGPYEFGPNPTAITFTLPEGASLEGELSASREPEKYYDDIFEINIGYYEGEVSFSQKVRGSGEVGLTVEWMACDENNCTPLNDETFSVTIGQQQKAPVSKSADGSIWSMILAAILWGFAALLTPCVFPIIPMTVSFFMKGDYKPAQNRFRARMYGVFIILLYTVPIAVLILVTRLIGGDAVTADIFNWLATHWLPNIIFFLVFMVFAASFFGAFEIVLPSKLSNSSDAQVDKRKGLGGVFFLALTLVLVSFSCTGPIVGTVLINATQGEFWAPIVTMFAFSLAFALPFVLFAMFPGLLKNLPKSGGWLNTVKVVLGFIEIALGFKFLSTADQVYHWGLLNREVYLAIWIVDFTLLGFYLLGKLKFKFDSDVKYISTGRLVLAIIDFAFVVWMIPGMFGAPLKALSGYLPPMETQEFVLGRQSASAPAPVQATVVSDDVQGVVLPGTGKYSDFLELPLGLQGFFDLDEAKAYAAAVGKPVFLDFTGHGCVNCREMESRVWSNPDVLGMLANDFVLCALYCDDKIKVDEKDWVTTDSGKTLKTLGKINSHFGLTEFGVAAQPFYVILSPSGEVRSTRSYNLDVDAFKAWLSSVK